jgi:ribonuclease-3
MKAKSAKSAGKAKTPKRAASPGRAPVRAKAPAKAAPKGSPEALELATCLDGALGYRFRDPDLLLRASLVNARALGELAMRLGLGPCIRLGRGERASGGELKKSILADSVEAVLGAIYLDGGARAARAFVRRHMGREIRAAQPARPQTGDFKTRLQEIVQAQGGPPPVYRLLSEAGPPHQKLFEVAVELPDGQAWLAIGASKKQAEQAAAEQALARLANPAGDLPEAPG